MLAMRIFSWSFFPGPRDRYGLPDTLAFWKYKIESRDIENTLAVGLLYGPSGCGKVLLDEGRNYPTAFKDNHSGLLGIYPRFHRTKVTPVFARRIEQHGRQSSFADLSLVELLGEIRRGRVFEKQQKVVLILDQFEQWLYAHPVMAGTELWMPSSRPWHSMQVIVMVRDDFWMAANKIFS